jgi:hypothetical protein
MSYLKMVWREKVMVLKRRAIVLVVLTVLLSLGGGVFAAQVNESTGPSGYGWQQVYDLTPNPDVRLTGSADRQYYDYGYKNITIAGRIENYWATDCGWWYVSGTPTIESFRIWDNSSDLVVDESNLPTSKGVANYSYTWGGSTAGNGMDDPGRWTVQVKNDTVVTQFYIYVRGRLDVTSISTAGSHAGNPVYVNGTIKDHANNIITSSTTNSPSVTMYVTGAGFATESTMAYQGGGWNASFTPPSPGDYYITVKAGDDHQYWIDGRGRTKAAITGSFPYSFAGSAIRTVIMILLALMWLGKTPLLKGRFRYR